MVVLHGAPRLDTCVLSPAQHAARGELRTHVLRQTKLFDQLIEDLRHTFTALACFWPPALDTCE